jgi:hypothetical protein
MEADMQRRKQLWSQFYQSSVENGRKNETKVSTKILLVISSKDSHSEK